MSLFRRPVAGRLWVVAFLLLFVDSAWQRPSETSILLQAPWASQQGWDPAASPPCSWTGITCHSDGTVSSVSLWSSQLAGTLPVAWGQLANLTLLDLESNYLVGTLPPQWSELTQLQSLKLSDNIITGQLPASWAQLGQLRVLDVSQNNLTGPLPANYSQLSQLQSLALNNNTLTGSLPPQWAQLNVMTLELSSNKLTSTLPELWMQLSQVQTLSLWDNQLTGSLPASWQHLQTLTELVLDYNNLNSTLPELWSQLSHLQALRLFHNQLTGPLPASWQHLQGLVYLELNSNKLNSTLPESWSQLKQLKVLRLWGNQLTGPLPDSWGQLAQLTVMDLGNNLFVGTLPANWSQLARAQYMGLYDNRLTGSLPSEWQQMQNISNIELNQNKLSGSLPQSWARLGQLQGVQLYSNNLSGTLPPSWADLDNLQKLCLSSNRLSGALPANYSRLKQLQYHVLGSNRLSGPVPESWLELTQLMNFAAGNNSLSGTLPHSWSALIQLQSFNMSHNALTGTLPTFGPGMLTIDVEGNNLTGTLPGDWLAAAYNLTSVNLGFNRLSGTVPPAWLLQLTAPSANLSELNLVYNDLSGGLPSSAAVGGLSTSNQSVGTMANVTLVPMNAGFGLCGLVPDGINAVSLTGERIPRILPAGPCPMAAMTEGSSASSRTMHVKIIVPVIVGALVTASAAMAFALRRMRCKIFRRPEQHVSMGKGHPQATLDPSAKAVTASTLGTDLKQPLQDRLAAHNRQRVMGAIAMGEVDVGPLLGRGAFGRVYKGRWRGTLVAIKVVEHAPGADALKQADLIEREALLATSLIHPNVVTTFKVCTMLASTAQALKSAGSADTDWSAANMARTPSLPQQPDSISEDGGSSSRRYMDSASTLHEYGSLGSGPPSAQATPRDSAMSEHGSGGTRLPQSPFSQQAAAGPADGLGGIPTSALPRGRSGGSIQASFNGAAAIAEEPALDSAAGNAGRHPAMLLAGAGEEYVLSPEEVDAEDDEEELRERQSRLLETWCLMEYAERGSLADSLRRGRLRRADSGTPNLAAIVQCMQDVASGMDYLHGAGILHGDLKPANVLLKSASEDTRGFICKLCDFGLSRLLDAAENTHLSTQTHGTMPYMPPELLEHMQLTPAADTYSFGMIMWESFTGQMPFQGLSIGQIYSRVVHDCVRPLLDAFSAAKERSAEERPALEVYTDLLQRCWAADPSLRPRFMEILSELSAIRSLLPLQPQDSLGSAGRSRSSSLSAAHRSQRLFNTAR